MELYVRSPYFLMAWC